MYEGIPKYIRQEMSEKYLASHIAEKFADSKILSPMNKSFLTQMIFHGKKLYLKDILMPKKSDEIKIGYNENQINWAVENVTKRIVYESSRGRKIDFSGLKMWAVKHHGIQISLEMFCS